MALRSQSQYWTGSPWSSPSRWRCRATKAAPPAATCSGLIIIWTGSPGAACTRAKIPIVISRKTPRLTISRRTMNAPMNTASDALPDPAHMMLVGAGRAARGTPPTRCRSADLPRADVDERVGEVAAGLEVLDPCVVRPHAFRVVEPEVRSLRVLDLGSLLVQ